jgi:flagellar basal body P-ring formation protein FlgA
MRTLVPFLAASLVAAPAAAAPFQNIDALEARVVGALGAGIGEPGGPAAPIDRRLKLAQCPATVAIDPPVMGAIALRCPGAGWRIRVPLARLGGAQVAQGYGAAPVKAEAVVKRGDPVDLVAEQAGFSVSVTAIAQEDGAPGSRIRVKTDGAKGIVFAEVLDAGLVRLPGFK